MATSILIVEDQFIEANDLRITVENAGHQVCGIAKSYDQAMTLLEKIRPDIVLLDIYLKGKLTGLDLALVLTKENIPFIYISANSNLSVLEAAKATRPYGFLVKPFREKDVLVALDIASYRHNHTAELISKHEGLLTAILKHIMGERLPAMEKMLMVVKAINPYIPFDYIHFDTDCNGPDLNQVFCFHRTGYDQYEYWTGQQILNDYDLGYQAYMDWRKIIASSNSTKIENGQDFEIARSKYPFLDNISKKFGVLSRMVLPLLNDDKHMSIRMYSKGRDSFKTDHQELMNPLRPLLAVVFGKAQDKGVNTSNLSRHTDMAIVETGTLLTEGIVGKSPKLLNALDQALQVANFDMSVLVLGETGVGKEGLVQAIHRLSNRNKKPLIKVNCAAIPVSLIESELFGHEKGAFTGAFERRIGKFEQAHGGTLFLDEIGEIPLEVQTKLLRVLQEKELERVGGRTTIKVDVRVVAATNRNLHEDVAAGRFRMDLYYRINVFPIFLAPLRERKEDIPLLTHYFLQQHARKTGTPVKQITSAVLNKLLAYSWPGNIRELLHLVERHIILSSSDVISTIELPENIVTAIDDLLEDKGFRSIAEVDKAHIMAALHKSNGRVSGKGGAAEMLNLPPTTLNSKMKKLGISWKFR
ncbi:sigma 54-interacting response regulator [Mucilaginibacter kameinonensis]|uniref:sigma 54-interacting response regulator n=1 Tax=Mucilaginibacter kameinonensis TaxID=452286 RepID=UPI000EF7EC07|nr:sigma 54-interacting response regulator [Mucilaginibacter kameinonensis]